MSEVAANATRRLIDGGAMLLSVQVPPLIFMML